MQWRERRQREARMEARVTRVEATMKSGNEAFQMGDGLGLYHFGERHHPLSCHRCIQSARSLFPSTIYSAFTMFPYSQIIKRLLEANCFFFS